MKKSDSGEVEVRADIIEMTSVEVQNGGAAAKVPVEITLLRDSTGQWMITGWNQ
jgi:hypothetical protein